MKLTLLPLLLSLALTPALLFAQTNSSGNAIDISIKASGANTKDKAPALFFSAKANSKSTINRTVGTPDSGTAIRVTTVINTTLSVLQGEPKMLSLDLDGPGEIVSITGPNLASWSVRQTIADPKTKTPAARRHLDLRPPLKSKVKEFPVTITIHQNLADGVAQLRLPTLGPGKAVGFTHQLHVTAPTELDLKVTKQDGLSRQDNPAKPDLREARFHTISHSHLAVSFSDRNPFLRQATFKDMALEGTVEPDASSAAMRLTGSVSVPASAHDRTIDLLSGNAALTSIPSFTNAHVRLHPASGKTPAIYKLHVEKSNAPRVFELALDFDAKLLREGAQNTLLFQVPVGTLVPLTLNGVPESAEINRKSRVVPRWKENAWRGFLPSDGQCHLSWKPERDTDEEGSLFYTSTANVDVRVAPGILRQSTQIDLKILQGELDSIALQVDGEGEILNVTGPQVVGWDLEGDDDAASKTLTINMSRPIESSGRLLITSQTPIGDFPVRAKPLRIIPPASVRHSGAIRVSNVGAVRLGIVDLAGLTQLAPEQFPGGKLSQAARQVFVYRFPSATHDYTITADAVLPETAVSQITRVEFGETDRIIHADLELDVREAPIRDFDITIPSGYSVATVEGANVSDHVLETDTGALQIIFNGAVQGRLLVKLRLERTAAAEPGSWQLPVLGFPKAESVRGHIGVSTTAGYRVTTGNAPGSLEGLTEIPQSTFPLRDEKLQQTYRIRAANYSAELEIEALGQHVEVDTFHLYSLKEGVAYGSVLLNYFVVGAPVQQWQLKIPENLGHVAIDGQDVRAWQRSGETVTVDLNQPALGAQTLLVTFEQPMPSRNSQLVPGTIIPLEVQGENGIIQVNSPQQLKHTWSKVSGNLLELDALELPAEFQLMSRSPSLGIYQYTERPFDLALDIEWLRRTQQPGLARRRRGHAGPLLRQNTRPQKPAPAAARGPRPVGSPGGRENRESAQERRRHDHQAAAERRPEHRRRRGHALRHQRALGVASAPASPAPVALDLVRPLARRDRTRQTPDCRPWCDRAAARPAAQRLRSVARHVDAQPDRRHLVVRRRLGARPDSAGVPQPYRRRALRPAVDRRHYRRAGARRARDGPQATGAEQNRRGLVDHRGRPNLRTSGPSCQHHGCALFMAGHLADAARSGPAVAAIVRRRQIAAPVTAAWLRRDRHRFVDATRRRGAVLLRTGRLPVSADWLARPARRTALDGEDGQAERTGPCRDGDHGADRSERSESGGSGGYGGAAPAALPAALRWFGPGHGKPVSRG